MDDAKANLDILVEGLKPDHNRFLIVSDGREHEYKIGLLDRASFERHLDCLAGSDFRVAMDALSNANLRTHRVDL